MQLHEMHSRSFHESSSSLPWPIADPNHLRTTRHVQVFTLTGYVTSISPDYFKNQFLETFGSISYVLELCGAYFGAFLFIKFGLDITVLVFRYFELRHLTGNTLSFTKTLLSASYNLFFTSVLTSVFTPQAPIEDSIEQRTKTEEIKEVELQNLRQKEESLYPSVQSFVAPV